MDKNLVANNTSKVITRTVCLGHHHCPHHYWTPVPSLLSVPVSSYHFPMIQRQARTSSGPNLSHVPVDWCLGVGTENECPFSTTSQIMGASPKSKVWSDAGEPRKRSSSQPRRQNGSSLSPLSPLSFHVSISSLFLPFLSFGAFLRCSVLCWAWQSLSTT